MPSDVFLRLIRKTFHAMDRLHRQAAKCLATRPPRGPQHTELVLAMGAGAAVAVFYLNAGGIQTECFRIWADGQLSLAGKIQSAWQFLAPRFDDPIAPGIPLGQAILTLLGIAFALDVLQRLASSLWRYASGQSLGQPDTDSSL